ncbi:hypothetical protein [Amycolatopsis australiensis]|uniref:Glycosyl transferase family 2 n=1 Tax=Amycolatopsis australiensis TaxID=546364 RepID=A0A1K1RP42_9PSEU|nr:hypothetical protein [Amycolatopsis australiensis]SFW73580.1 hypothetical protein SAMN04489730_3630 [Amycolatopsis australiensis]
MNARQHSSHRGLLTPFAGPERHAPLDAIIVPSGRPARALDQAIAAAKQHDALLVVLCSMLAKADSAADRASRAGARVLALDTAQLPAGTVPELATDRLLRSSRYNRNTDTGLKRNLGLLLARLAGWERIFFLDDDILLPALPDLTAAAGLLDEFPVVGLANRGMPDNSVVCHALRDVGVEQDTFIGGGALAVGRAAFESFFPDVYNEDWFFVMEWVRRRRAAVTGKAFQRRYDPYQSVVRARGEELGDTLAEGIFGLLDSGRPLADADERYWAAFLHDRRRIIRDVLGRVRESAIEPGRKARMIDALLAGFRRSQTIQPEFCVRYLRAWQGDCARWREHVDELDRDHRGGSEEKALAALGIGHLAEWGVTGARPRSATPPLAPV